jgi:hypothetical protein
VRRPCGFQEVGATRFPESWHMRVVNVISPTHRPPLPHRVVDAECQSTAGRIMSIKNLKDSIGYRTRNPLACSAVPQTTAPPRDPISRIFPTKKQKWRSAKYLSQEKGFYMWRSLKSTEKNGIHSIVTHNRFFSTWGPLNHWRPGDGVRRGVICAAECGVMKLFLCY